MDTVPTVDQSPSPAELLAARREARRKKILENSNNRLSKIVGRNSPLTTSSSDAANDDEPTFPQPESIIYPDPEDERVVYENTEHDPFQASTEQQDFSAMNGLMNGQNGDIFQLLNRLNQRQGNEGQSMGNAGAPPVQHVRLRRILHTKVHLMVAAVIVYLLFATGSERFIGGSVFLPLLAWEVIELLTLGSSDTNVGGPLLSLVLMFGGIPMRTSRMLQTVAGTINKVLKDVTFFVFFFVLTHLLWSRFGLGLELRYVLGYDQLESTTDDILMSGGVLS
ncbi:uncharacterized protein LOC131208570 [Anopheles bellator]|uniref:uncharacterized protein LOC131208570 n=1 Tax=Anopheles bellator TaxID=139047 RepID=UPI00264748C1|nr:uncharacterized protein LOC131208570 [Anopheles bellator]